MKIVLFCFLTIGFANVAFGSNCANRYREYLRAAQRLDSETPTLAGEMKSCVSFADEVSYWLQFYHVARGEHEAAADVGRTMRLEDYSPQASERLNVLSAAKRGQYRSLEERVKEGRAGFANDAEGLLVLARALIRDRRYPDGRDMYDRYLTLKIDDWEIRLERTLTYVWSGEKATARAELEKVAAFDHRREYRDAAGAVLSTLSEQRVVELTTGARLIGALERYRTSDHYDRTTTKLGWDDGRYQFTLLSHEIHSEPLSRKTTLLGTEVLIGAQIPIVEWLTLKGVAGALLAKDSKAVYDLQAVYHGGRTQFAVGTLQQSLARYLPLLHDDFSLLDRAHYVDVQYGNWMRYRAEFHQVRDYEPFQKHNLVLRPRVLEERFSDADIRLRAGVQHEEHERPNALYYSPKRASLGFMGAEQKRRITRDLELHVQYDRGVVFFATRAASKAEKKIQHYNVSLDATYTINPEWDVYLSGHFSESHDQDLALSTYDSNRIELGVYWNYEKPSKK